MNLEDKDVDRSLYRSALTTGQIRTDLSLTGGQYLQERIRIEWIGEKGISATDDHLDAIKPQGRMMMMTFRVTLLSIHERSKKRSN
jgi:hypothetical protein